MCKIQFKLNSSTSLFDVLFNIRTDLFSDTHFSTRLLSELDKSTKFLDDEKIILKTLLESDHKNITIDLNDSLDDDVFRALSWTDKELSDWFKRWVTSFLDNIENFYFEKNRRGRKYQFISLLSLEDENDVESMYKYSIWMADKFLREQENWIEKYPFYTEFLSEIKTISENTRKIGNKFYKNLSWTYKIKLLNRNWDLEDSEYLNHESSLESFFKHTSKIKDVISETKKEITRYNSSFIHWYLINSDFLTFLDNLVTKFEIFFSDFIKESIDSLDLDTYQILGTERSNFNLWRISKLLKVTPVSWYNFLNENYRVVSQRGFYNRWTGYGDLFWNYLPFFKKRKKEIENTSFVKVQIKKYLKLVEENYETLLINYIKNVKTLHSFEYSETPLFSIWELSSLINLDKKSKIKILILLLTFLSSNLSNSSYNVLFENIPNLKKEDKDLFILFFSRKYNKSIFYRLFILVKVLEEL